jgi:hypothetical protein
LESAYEDPLPPSLSGIWNDIALGRTVLQLVHPALAERAKTALEGSSSGARLRAGR